MDETKGLVFKARVLMEKTEIQVGKRLVKLTPGMSVTVEAKTGKRRLIEYFLAPLLKYKQESIRER
jgi:hemolysin D